MGPHAKLCARDRGQNCTSSKVSRTIVARRQSFYGILQILALREDCPCTIMGNCAIELEAGSGVCLPRGGAESGRLSRLAQSPPKFRLSLAHFPSRVILTNSAPNWTSMPTPHPHAPLRVADQKLHTLAVPRQQHFVHAKFAAQATGTEYPNDGPPTRLLDLEQKAGHPDYHKNFVFLSAGYKKDEKMKFKAAVYSAATAFMNGDMRYSTADGLIPTPWDRYMPLINVYVVWQPSVDSGATIPVKASGQPHEGYAPLPDWQP